MFGIIKNYKYLNVYYCLKEQKYSSHYSSLMRIIKRTKSTYFNRDGISVLHCAPRSVWPVFTDCQCGSEHRSIYSVQMAPTISLNSQCRCHCGQCFSTRLSESSVNGLLKLLIPRNVCSSVTYLAIWRCDHVSRGSCGYECGGCASPNFRICDTTQYVISAAADFIFFEYVK